MSEENKNDDLSNVEDQSGALGGLARTVRLVLHLMADRRVNIFLKLLPIASIAYLISPLDAAVPVVDDALIVGLGTYVFIELCPPDVVEEIKTNLAGSGSAGDPDSVVDAEFTDKED